jgi:hypothetical protein
MSFAATFTKALRHFAGHFARILRPPRKKPVPNQWLQQLQRMQNCQTASDLVRDFGEPDHKDFQREFEFWHYPLGVVEGFFYSIHAAIVDDRATQVYIHTQPVDGDEGSALRNQPKPPVKPKASGAFLEDPELYKKICGANPNQQRKAALAVARWALDRTGLKDPLFDRVFSQTDAGPLNPALVDDLDKLVEELELDYEKAVELGLPEKEDEPSAFQLARAASCVAFAIKGDAAQAVYETFFATDDRPEARRVMLAALSS